MSNFSTKKYKSALILMIIHAILVIAWNIVGVWLISNGKSALGPTATLVGALIFTVLIAIYLLFYKKEYERFFLIAVIIGALLGSMAIYGAFTKDPNLWPSEFWRYAGVAVNSLGVLGLLFTLIAFFKKKY